MSRLNSWPQCWSIQILIHLNVWFDLSYFWVYLMQICWTVFPNYILQIWAVWYFNFSTWFSMKALTLCSIPSQVNSYGRYGSICSQSQNTQFRRKSGHTSDFKQQTASVVRVFTLPLPLCAGGGCAGEDGRVQPEPGRLRLAMDHEAYEALLAHMVNRPIVPSDSTENKFWVCT